MQKTSILTISAVLLIILGMGILVRNEVVKDRTMPTPQPVTSFTSCVEARYSLDSTGTECTTPDGHIFSKPGSISATTTPIPQPIATTTPTSTMSLKGTVTGTVKIGPICPVERVDQPCVVPPETYTSRSVIVYNKDLTRELEQQALSATGRYSLSLQPGTYGLQIRPAGIGAGEIKTVTVIAGQSSNVDFDIDTGIR